MTQLSLFDMPAPAHVPSTRSVKPSLTQTEVRQFTHAVDQALRWLDAGFTSRDPGAVDQFVKEINHRIFEFGQRLEFRTVPEGFQAKHEASCARVLDRLDDVLDAIASAPAWSQVQPGEAFDDGRHDWLQKSDGTTWIRLVVSMERKAA